MNRKTLVATLVATLALGLAGLSQSKTIDLPADGMQLKESSLPGYAKARANCTACHSAEYMLYQPANAPRAYWEGMVKRMKVVFKAPVDEADMPEIVDYLVKTYGNEQPR
jgi:hypothetical protein